MSNEEKILEMLTSMQEDMKVMKADIDSLKNGNNQNIQKQIEAIEQFSRADTPEDQAEVEAFLKFMDTEEERKAAKYAV